MAHILRKPRSNPGSGAIEVYYQIQTQTGLVTLGYVTEAEAQDRLTLERAAEIRARRDQREATESPPPPSQGLAPGLEWLTTEQASAWLQVSSGCVDELKAGGHLAGAYFQVGATLRFHRDTLQAVLLRTTAQRPGPGSVAASPMSVTPVRPAATSTRSRSLTREERERRIAEIMAGAPDVLGRDGALTSKEILERMAEAKAHLQARGLYDEYREHMAALYPTRPTRTRTPDPAPPAETSGPRRPRPRKRSKALT